MGGDTLMGIREELENDTEWNRLFVQDIADWIYSLSPIDKDNDACYSASSNRNTTSSEDNI